jgi:hypothetical protein
MKTITTDLYSFTELTQEAKDVAIQNFLSTDREYHWGGEWLDSLNALAEHFLGTVRSYSVSPYSPSHATINSRLDDDILDLAGIRAWTWLLNNGLFIDGDFMPTGYCGDCAAFRPLLDFCTRPAPDSTTIRDVIAQCCDSLVGDWEADMRYQDSEEFAEDELLVRSDEELFTIDGSTF